MVKNKLNLILVRILTGEDLLTEAINECDVLRAYYRIPKRGFKRVSNVNMQDAIVNYFENKNGMQEVLPELFAALRSNN